jgi:hypothetical protein
MIEKRKDLCLVLGGSFDVVIGYWKLVISYWEHGFGYSKLITNKVELKMEEFASF